MLSPEIIRYLLNNTTLVNNQLRIKQTSGFKRIFMQNSLAKTVYCKYGNPVKIQKSIFYQLGCL